MSVIQIVKSERGKDHVFFNGFTFRKAYYHSTVGGWKWRCTNKKCAASMYVDNELTMMPGSFCEHNHSPMSRKRQYMKEMGLMDPFFVADSPANAAIPPPTASVKEESQSMTNGDINESEMPKNDKAVNGLAQQKPKRARRTNLGVRRKRQKKMVEIPEGTHHLAEDCEFPLDQCDSNTVFVNIFENQNQHTQQVNRTSTSNRTAGEEQPENFDPLSETFRTTAFPAICDLSPKDEEVNVPNEVIDLDNEDETVNNAATNGANDDFLLYEDVSLRRNVRLYPSHYQDSSKNSSSRSVCMQNSRARLMQGSIDLSHPVDTFFYAMAQSVKRLSTVNQIKAKQMITKLITKFEMDEAI